MKNTFLALLFIMAFALGAKAQLSGNAGIVTNQSVTIPQGQNCATLNATVTGGAITTNYVASQIAYNPPVPYDTGTIVLYHTDDLWSQPITLPFNFCFWGAAYNKIIIGSNGELSFDINNSPAFNNWSITGPLPVNSEADQRNVIMAPWQDLDPTYHGVLKYIIGGTAPNRYFAASWNDCPMFGDSGSVDTGYCSHLDHQTSMAVLYETTNIIDIYVQNKGVICNDLTGVYWNGGLAIEGITNSNMIVWCTVPGRNGTQWAAQNDAWRFTPSGPPNYAIGWFQTGTQLGNADTQTVCPTAPTSYVIQVAYTLCDNSIVTLYDTVTVGFAFALLSPVITYPDCIHTGSILAQVSGNLGGLTYSWSNGETGALDTALTPGTYGLTVTNSIGQSVSASYVLTQNLQGAINNAAIINPGCGSAGSISLANSPGNNATDTYTWSNGQTSVNDTGLVAGNYSLTISDTAGCSATSNYVVQQDTPITISGALVYAPCYNSANGRITLQVSGGTNGAYAYLWSNQATTAVISGLGTGTYSVTITGPLACSVSASYVLGPPLTVNEVLNHPSCPIPGSVFTLQTTGGTVPYSYHWSPNLSSTDSLIIPSGGLYSATVSDANGCSVTPGSVYIDSGVNSIRITGDSIFCSGTSATYTESETQNGFSARVLWKLNGVIVDSLSTTYTDFAVNDGDVVTCTLTDSCGLPVMVTSNSITIHIDQAPAQPLCVVSADSAGTANVAIWEKVNKPATDNFFIYRTNTPDTTYVQIAAIPRDSLSEYQDSTANPQLTSYRYKMNLEDTCGNYSPLSNYIQTIFMQYLGGGTFGWTPYVVENETSPVTGYNLMRDTTGTGNWYVVTGTATDTTIIDPDYSSYPGASYEVEAILNTSCTPTRSISIVTSNVISDILTDLRPVANGKIRLMPNPAHNQFEIENSNSGDNLNSFVLFDQLGNRLSAPYSVSGDGRIKVDINSLSVGLYYVFINYESSNAILKLVKY